MSTLATGFSSLEDAISTFENTNPAYNNPGAIMANSSIASEFGATGAAGNGLAIFPTEEQGAAALDESVQGYAASGATVSDFVNSYAPPQDGNPNNANYISQISQETGLGPGEQLSDLGTSSPAGIGSAATTAIFPGLQSAINYLENGSTMDGTASGKAATQSGYLGRGVAIVLGFIVLGAGLFLFKPVQDTIVTAGKAAVKAAIP